MYRDLKDLESYRELVADADAVIVGSCVPDGVSVGRFVQATARGVKAFYDLDTPTTLARLRERDYEYISQELIPGYDVYLTFTGGPMLERLVRRYGAKSAHALHCSVDADRYRPVRAPLLFDLGYLGAYSPDRQGGLERLLIEPARRAPELKFVVAGPQYPKSIQWPANVTRIEHLVEADHVDFYAQCRFTLNLTRATMIRAGYSPSVRLFEAAACGTPVISDRWRGIDTFLSPGREIVLARTASEVLNVLQNWQESRRMSLALAARRRVLNEHTARHRARALEDHIHRILGRPLAALKRLSALGDPTRDRRVPPLV